MARKRAFIAHTVPFMASIALVAASEVSKVTKPKPRERPEYLSTITLACQHRTTCHLLSLL